MTRKPLPQAALLGALAFLAGLPGLNSIDFSHDNEAYYVLGAQEMLETGGYLCPLYLGRIHLDKPPSYYWAVCFFDRTVGLSLVSARLPSLIAQALTVVMVYLFAFWIFQETRSSLFAALAMMSFYVAYRYSRLSMTDTCMALGTVVAVFFTARGLIEEERRPLHFFLASTGIGFAGLAKGHVGAVVSAFPVIVYLLLAWRKEKTLPWRNLLAPYTWAPAILLSGWWYAVIFTSHTPAADLSTAYTGSTSTLGEIARNFFFNEVKERSGGGVSGLFRNLFAYAGFVLLHYGPWSWFVLAGFLAPGKVLREEQRIRPREFLALFALALAILFLFIVVIRSRRNERYLLPMAPVIAILAGRYLHLWAERTGTAFRRNLPWVISGVMILTYLVIFTVLRPAMVGRPVQELCDQLRPRLEAEDQVLFCGNGPGRFLKKHALAMGRLGHRTRFYGSAGELVEALRKRAEAKPKGTLYLFIEKAAYESIPETWRSRLTPLGKSYRYRKWRHLEDVRDRLDDKPSLEILLMRFR